MPSLQPSSFLQQQPGPGPFQASGCFSSAAVAWQSPPYGPQAPWSARSCFCGPCQWGPPAPRTCSVLSTREGSAPRLNPSHMSPSSTAGILTKTTSKKNKTNTQKMEREGFCKVLLGSYFYIILPICGLCSGNLETNALCFYGFLWRCPSGRALSGGHPGQSSGGISQVQTRGEPANMAFPSQWAVFWLLCVF